MKFSAFPYVRPDMDQIRSQFNQYIEKFENAQSAQEQIEVIHEINKIRNTIETTGALVQVRHTINTEDAFYDAENDFIDEVMPQYTEMVDLYYRVMNQSKFKAELVEEFGQHIFNIIDVKLKTFTPDILEDLKQENILNSKYTKLRTSAKIMFEGEERNLAQMVPFYESVNRETRKAAQMASTKFFEENETAFDELYHEMVQVRHRIAQKLGYENFVEVGYMRLSRTDYDQHKVATYRKQVLEDLVPLTVKLRERQMKRLGRSEERRVG